MSTSSEKLEAFGAFIRSSSGCGTTRTMSLMDSEPRRFDHVRRVLIVESRRDVLARLRRVIERLAIDVMDAECGGTVRHIVRNWGPDVVLMNENLPDESGWLVATKLRWSLEPPRMWLYAARQVHCLAQWQELTGVEHVFSYGGDLLKLIQETRLHISTCNHVVEKDHEHTLLPVHRVA